MKRILFYVHFNKYGNLSEHVVYQLKNIKPLFETIVLISNSKISTNDKKSIEGVYDEFIERENIGFDFAGWRDGLNYVDWDKVAEYDSVTMMNDTCFGPIYPLEDSYLKMEKSGVDFWGMTNHRSTKASVYGIGEVPYHIQSYMQVFSNKVVTSQAFKNFWLNVADHTDVNKVIQEYELGLTGILDEAGFSHDVFFDTVKYHKEHDTPDYQDYSQLAVPIILENKVPIIKLKAFLHNSDNMLANHLIEQIGKQTKYNTSLIENYFEDNFDPSISLGIGDKVLPKISSTVKQSNSVAIHIHAFYPDILEKYLIRMKEWDFKYSLFITVDTNKKKLLIEKALKKYNIVAKDITITGNKGRDVVPWLSIADKLKDYDIVGHFHTKKSKTSNFYVGEKWQHELLTQLFDSQSANNIIANFTKNKKLGVVIPDIPNVFAYLGGTVYSYERNIKPYIDTLWNRLGAKKQWSIDNQLTFVMPYGTMLWYRPAALNKLTSIQLADDEIPEEPLVDNFGTYLHAIERLIVYASWDAGYYYRLAPNHEYTSRFFDNLAYNRTFHALQSVHTISTRSAIKLIGKRALNKTPLIVQKMAKKAKRIIR